jgi:hypothetical protein
MRREAGKVVEVLEIKIEGVDGNRKTAYSSASA